ncbi:hypothetical protein [Mycolicibacterium sp.]|uniref:hypothetical protein n=1 Tax=Mycolicibacterium sp. TaxID=2320850 RepID=UPI00355F88CF
MFQSIRSAYGALGVMLFLVALYLVLQNATGATNIIRAGGSTGVELFRTLQGR